MTSLDPIALARDLIERPSVTPEDAGALDVLGYALQAGGFSTSRHAFPEDAPVVENLFAKATTGDGPHFCFAGHTDVVPPGDEAAWTHPPFSATLDDDALWGRGAADMKGAIAAFTAAASQALAAGEVRGSISLLITGDEEGPALHGTRKLLEAIAARGEKIDHCLVGEPSNPEAIGDMIKIGRRGSVNCWLTVTGVQGHVAYPHRAKNPIPALLKKLLTLSEAPLDDGYENFEPTNLEITDIHVGNPAHNVIPEKAAARFNVRFNPNWTGASIEAFLREQIETASAGLDVAYDLSCVVSGEAFLTRDEAYLSLLADAVENETGRRPVFSTGGGTSDARFIKDYAPVAEFGLVGATMHKVDEHVAVADIELLTRIYREVIRRYFA